jgi:hypothetical protein
MYLPPSKACAHESLCITNTSESVNFLYPLKKNQHLIHLHTERKVEHTKIFTLKFQIQIFNLMKYSQIL